MLNFPRFPIYRRRFSRATLHVGCGGCARQLIARDRLNDRRRRTMHDRIAMHGFRRGSLAPAAITPMMCFGEQAFCLVTSSLCERFGLLITTSKCRMSDSSPWYFPFAHDE